MCTYMGILYVYTLCNIIFYCDIIIQMRIIIENYENILIMYTHFLIFFHSPKIANKIIYE